MVKEVVEPMLDEGQHEEKLQEPYYYVIEPSNLYKLKHGCPRLTH